MNKSVSYKVAQKSHNHRACWPKWYLVSIMTFNSGFESLHKQLPGKKKKKKSLLIRVVVDGGVLPPPPFNDHNSPHERILTFSESLYVRLKKFM